MWEATRGRSLLQLLSELALVYGDFVLELSSGKGGEAVGQAACDKYLTMSPPSPFETLLHSPSRSQLQRLRELGLFSLGLKI